MRLFIGIDIEKNWKEECENIQRDIILHSKKTRTTDTDNMHITLKFLGDVDDNKFLEISKIFKEMPLNIKNMELELSDVNSFKKINTETVWVGMYENRKIYSLKKILEENFEKIGFKREKRRYIPHITIAKNTIWKDNFQVIDLIKPNTDILKVKNITLYESVIIDKKVVYKKLLDRAI